MSAHSIKDYEVYNILGKGSFASVFRSLNKYTTQEVAIKMIDKNLMKVKGMVLRVKNEVEIHSRLKHPSITELYDYFEDKQYVYLILELCHMGELGTYISYNKENEKGIPERQSSIFMEQILDGLLYLHSNQIIHRDLTVSNVLLDKNLHVKIADFGLAILLRKPDEKHFTMCGTPNFIAPETASNTAHGMESDIWSLGCILFTMLCGQPPFDTRNVKSTLSRVVAGQFATPDYLSWEAKDLIDRFLRRNPMDRISLNDVYQHPFMTRNSSPDSSLRRGMMDDTMIFTKHPKRFPLKAIDGNIDRGPSLGNEHGNPPTSSSCGRQPRLRGTVKRVPFSPNLPVLEESEHSGHQNGSLSCLGTQENYNAVTRDASKYPYNGTTKNASPYDPHQNLSAKRSIAWNGDTDHVGVKTSNISLVKDLRQQLNGLRISGTRTASANLFDHDTARRNKMAGPGGGRTLAHLASPIKTFRLRPFRQRNKNILMTILPNGEARLDVVGVGSNVLDEVFKISPDGLKIEVSEFRGGKLTNRCAFNYTNLPKTYWKKYIYAYRFIKLIKTKTPKVTLYTQHAKCHLMENGPVQDFEASFYDGSKYTVIHSYIREPGVTTTKIVDPNGVSHNLDRVSDKARLGSDIALAKDVELAEDYHGQCLNLQKLLEAFEKSNAYTDSPFPAIVGKNPKRFSTTAFKSRDQGPVLGAGASAQAEESQKMISTTGAHRGIGEDERSGTVLSQPNDKRSQEAYDNIGKGDRFHTERASNKMDSEDGTNSYVYSATPTAYPYKLGGESQLSYQNSMASSQARLLRDGRLSSFAEKYHDDDATTVTNDREDFVSNPQAPNGRLTSGQELVSAYIPGLCWGVFDKSSDLVTAKFLDGSQLIFGPLLDRIRYTERDAPGSESPAGCYGREYDFFPDDPTNHIPAHVKRKLEKMPILLAKILNNDKGRK